MLLQVGPKIQYYFVYWVIGNIPFTSKDEQVGVFNETHTLSSFSVKRFKSLRIFGEKTFGTSIITLLLFFVCVPVSEIRQF